MDLHLHHDESSITNDTYDITFGKRIQRMGKIFSYTFWRTEIKGKIFWSVQGNDANGSGWIMTKYFGLPKKGKYYQQEIILHHPTEKKIKLYYSAPCIDGNNCIQISRQIMQLFKTVDNSFYFEFRLLLLNSYNS